MSTSEDLLRLVPQPLGHLLRELEAQQARRRQGSREAVPRLTAWLVGGQTLEAEFVGLSEDELTLVVAAGIAITYLPVRCLAGLTVYHDAASLRSAASKPVPTETPAPTRLAINRRLAGLGGDPSWQGTCRWEDFPSDDATLTRLSRIIDEVDAVLEKHPRGLDVKGLTLQGGESMTARFEAGILTLSVPRSGGDARQAVADGLS